MTTQRGKASRARRRKKPAAARGGAASEARLKQKVARLSRELKEAREQQTATAEVLGVISSSPGALQPVFEAMLANAVRLCEAKFGVLFLSEGEAFRVVALHGAPPAFAEARRREPLVRPNPGGTLGRVAATKQPVQIADMRAEQAVTNDPGRFAILDLAGARTMLNVPMLKKSELIGQIAIYRQEVRPFTDKQIELLASFAAQAVIAIENARLLNELRQRTDDLGEALEQQTATSEVLKVISSSPGELEPVFQAMLANAVRVCEAKFGVLFRYRDGAFHAAASLSVPPAYAEFLRGVSFRPDADPTLANTPLHRLFLSKDIVQSDDESAEANPGPAARYGGARSLIAVPLRKENELIGAFVIYRLEVRPFTDKQVELVTNFAAQAVIAIENTRLLNELRQRTDDLSEALEQQTATSEVLEIISSSQGELDPVFQAILANATRICEAKFGILFRYDNGALYPTATLNAPPALSDFLRQHSPYLPVPGQPLHRLIRTKQVVHTLDQAAEQVQTPSARLAGARSHIAVPMLKENELVGTISVYRQEVRPFTDKQIELVSNFAKQAVIAIENTRLLTELRQRTDDLGEALEQQTATSDVLQVISSSPGELEPVFQSMLANATRICEAKIGILFRYEDGTYTAVAKLGVTLAYAEYLDRGPIRPGATTGLGRVASTRQTIHIVDTHAEQAYADREPFRVATAELGGARSLLNVPMLKEGRLIGAIGIYRQEVRPFTDKQVELVTNFAAQAVIAIENARLLNELRQRTDDLSEALEQQTATSKVLTVISSSPGELEPVFQSMLENATRLCAAKFGTMYIREADAFRAVAMHGAPPAYVKARLHALVRPGPHSALSRAAKTKRAVLVDDASADEGYSERDPMRVSAVEMGGVRTLLDVPMLKDDEMIGAIAIYRQEVRPFTDKQVELVSNFAKQAVIAIENARLLKELRQRTDDLGEALEQQTATSEVLQVISSSPGELQPVFDAVLANATHICEAKFANLFLSDGDAFRVAAMHNAPPDYAEQRPRHPIRHGPTTGLGRCAATRQVVQIADLSAEPEAAPILAGFAGARTFLLVPMLKENQLIGAIGIYRQEVRPFTDKQVELVTNFAAQAVIAIENTRLLNELRQRTDDLGEALEQQTATSEVLQVISSSPGELEPVFETMLANATRICEAKFGTLYLYEGDAFRVVALHGAPPAYADQRRREPVVRPPPGTGLARVIATKQVAHIVDIKQEPGYAARDPRVVALGDLAGARSLVAVPMLKEQELVGAIAIYRQEVRPFTDKQIELVQNFAAQAIIAIENTRLLNELRQRTDDLSEALEQQTATSEVLKVISSSPGGLEPVFEAVLENAVRICRARFGNLLLFDGTNMRVVATHNAPAALAEERRRNPFIPLGLSILGPLVRTKSLVHVADIAAEEPYASSPLAKSAGARTALGVPMLREDELVGAIAIYHQEVCPFTDKQIELVQNFAAQAVIAIENARLLNELREALQQQTATADVLRVISSSPGELNPVFDTLLSNATNICDAKFGNLFMYRDGAFTLVAMHNAPAAYAEARRRAPIRPPLGAGLGQVAITKQVSQVTDLMAEQAYIDRHPFAVQGVELAGIRTLLAVPMLKDDQLVGGIVIYRQEVRPFSDKQIELVKSFAAQAVIAIENTRLLNELRESLQQQTATSEVLSVISSSPGELERVFETMLANATRLCDAKFGTLWLCKGDGFHATAMHNAPPAYAEARRRDPLVQIRPDGPLGRVAATKQVAHIVDIKKIPSYVEGDPSIVAAADLAGYRTTLAVPMLKDDELIGSITIARQEVRPFTDKQIELVTNFAAQAVIAIENTRLLSELRESLQQQTATADVLKIISRSTFDLKAVLNTLVESAVRLCDADLGNIARPADDGFFRVEANYGMSSALMELMQRTPIRAGRGSAIGRALQEKTTVHILDAQTDPDYRLVEARELGGFHTMLGVPLLREGTPIGVFALVRRVVRPFTDKQIELVTTFADQAVIAIENVRLFDEIQDKSRQLAEASQHKSQFLANMSHELRTPLNAILGYTELIRDSVYGEPPEKMRDVLKRIESNGKHLLGLINDVLDLSKIEAGQLVLSLADYSLKDVVHGVFSAVEPLAAEKKLAFKVEVAKDLPAGRGDERRITQVLLNLVGNAIKFTDQGEVTIRAAAVDGSYNVSVSDTGPGISEADQAKLFQEFQQADNSITRRKGGTGLGLAISKRIIELQGGRIWVDSRPGQGSTFFVSLPVEVEQQARPT